MLLRLALVAEQHVKYGQQLYVERRLVTHQFCHLRFISRTVGEAQLDRVETILISPSPGTLTVMNQALETERELQPLSIQI